MPADAPELDMSNDVKQLLDDAYNARINNLKKSTALAKKALQLSRELNDSALIGRSLNQLALFYMITGDHTKAISSANEAIKYYELINDEQGIADAKYNLAGVYYKTDNYHLALTLLIDSLVIYRKYSDFHNHARTQKSLGTIYEYIGDAKNAERAYNYCIEAAEKINDKNLVSNAYNPLSGMYLKQGKVKEALDIIEQAISIKEATGDIRGLAFSVYGRAKVFITLSRYEEAERDLDTSLKIHIEEGERLGRAMTMYRQGILYFEVGNNQKAKEILAETLAFCDEFNVSIIRFKANYLLYRIFKQENDTQKSLEYLELYLKLKEAVINTQTLKVIENYELRTKVEAMRAQARAEKEKAEIIEKKELAERSAVIKQDFLSSMSHEIRTPLNAIISIISLLDGRTDAEEREMFDALKFASNNLLMIINDILDFNKLDVGKVEIEYKATEIRPLIDQIIHIYDNLARAKGLELKTVFADDVDARYELDETKLTQILGNLISNAIKFTDDGSVTLRIEKVKGNENFDEIRFVVADTGMGITSEFEGKMFESFSQPKGATTRKQGGSGLGLAIVKKLVQLHGSEINYKSNTGKGSEFDFSLQLKKCVEVNKTTKEDWGKLMNKNVLLAEDNMINAMVARKLLSKWGIVSEHAINGLEAVAMSKVKAYDLILMDIHMPEMNGFDATAAIRNEENLNQTTPIFALTADITARYQTEYVQYFTGFLNKPIEVDKLQQAIMGGLYQ